MFYSQLVLTKRGPLGRIWLAAHWQKKLTKSQVTQTNILQSVDAIAKPDVPLALRTSGHLLLGVVRIFERQAKYLLIDCGDALQKFKQAFRTDQTELDPKQARAAFDTVTLPTEGGSMVDDLEDFVVGSLPSNNFFDVDSNQARREDITLQEGQDRLSSQLSRSNSMMVDEMFDVGRGEVLAFDGKHATNPEDDLSPEQLRDFNVDFVNPIEMLPENDFGIEQPEDLQLEMERSAPGSVISHPQDPEALEEYDYGLQQNVGQVQLKRGSGVLIDQSTEMSTSEIREMLKDTSGIIAKPQLLGLPSRSKRLRVSAPRLREPMVTAFPAVVCAMLQHKLATDANVPDVEKSRRARDMNAAGPADSTAVHTPGLLDDGARLEAEGSIDAPGTIGSFGGAEEISAGPEDFEIPMGGSELNGVSSIEENETSNYPMEATVSDGPASEAADGGNKDGFTVNTKAMVSSLQEIFEKQDSVNLQEVLGSRLATTQGRRTRVAAQSFYEMLVLKSKDFLHLEQLAPYTDITVAPTEKLADFHF